MLTFYKKLFLLDLDLVLSLHPRHLGLLLLESHLDSVKGKLVLPDDQLETLVGTLVLDIFARPSRNPAQEDLLEWARRVLPKGILSIELLDVVQEPGIDQEVFHLEFLD